MINNITRLREIQLELLKEFSRVCEAHDLAWYACFGTLLGAMRYEGFLPLDDDVDVVMPSKDYFELCRHKEWFGEEFFLQTPLDEGFLSIARLRKNGTTAIKGDLLEQLRTGGHQGIPIDIIPLDEIPGSGTFRTPTLGRDKRGAVYLKEWFEPAGTAKFEGVTIRIPAKPRKVLKEVYDDWAWPNGAQRSHMGFWFLDPDNGYEMYQKRYTGMLDDIDGKKIYLFGAADSLRIWLERFGRRDQVVCTFDNDPGKWGKKVFDVEVRNPDTIPSLLDENSRLIIVSIWHQEIGRQLERMGIKDYYVYLDFYLDEKVGNKVVRREEMPGGQMTIPKWDA